MEWESIFTRTITTSSSTRSCQSSNRVFVVGNCYNLLQEKCHLLAVKLEALDKKSRLIIDELVIGVHWADRGAVSTG
jgi:hypothetical protein